MDVPLPLDSPLGARWRYAPRRLDRDPKLLVTSRGLAVELCPKGCLQTARRPRVPRGTPASMRSAPPISSVTLRHSRAHSSSHSAPADPRGHELQWVGSASERNPLGRARRIGRFQDLCVRCRLRGRDRRGKRRFARFAISAQSGSAKSSRVARSRTGAPASIPARPQSARSTSASGAVSSATMRRSSASNPVVRDRRRDQSPPGAPSVSGSTCKPRRAA